MPENARSTQTVSGGGNPRGCQKRCGRRWVGAGACAGALPAVLGLAAALASGGAAGGRPPALVLGAAALQATGPVPAFVDQPQLAAPTASGARVAVLLAACVAAPGRGVRRSAGAASRRMAAHLAMPPVLRRIAQCETGLVDGRPNWRFRTRDFATAFGIHRAAWHDFHRYVRGAPAQPEVATPRQQVAVALAIYRYAGGGWAAWGCFRHNAWVRAALR